MTDSFATEPASMTAATTTACVAAGGTQSVDDTDCSSEQTRQPASGARKGPLLSGLGDSASQSRAPASSGTKSSKKVDHQAFDNHLAMVRLGIATSLFYALRCKHTPTAAHSLRVALVSSAWCQRLGLEASARDRIEVAALLHDIGKIGIPDRILRKPAKLSDEEQLTMQCCPELAGEILRGCTSDKELLSIVRHAGTWYQGRRHHDGPVGDALPMGSRMLSIVGAFDAMTTNQVYRRAMSRERALKELFHGCGTQFDPEMTHDFVSMLEDRPELLHHRVIHRWLQNLDGGDDSFLFGRQSASAHSTASTHNNSESQNAARQNEASGMMRLTEGSKAPSTSSSSIPDRVSRFDAYFEIWSRQSRDGVVFTDGDGQVVFWNDSMTRLTGITTEAIVGTQWDCETIGLQPRLPVQTTDDDAPETSADDEVHLSCPVQECLQRRTTVPKTMRLRRRSTSGQEKPRDVWVQASPVSDARAQGVVLEIEDMSDRTELEQQIESLHVRAASDPLTGVANRAELDRQLDEITCRAQQGEGSFSLIICDIDHFKRVNDVHGHPAGDEALIEFANVLSLYAQGNDLVARYGGEEFVVLVDASDNATATQRAEDIRQAIASTPLDGLGGESVTASFGVTEFQNGDAADTVLARADRALLQAKENGRNRVVQLGSGVVQSNEENESAGWFQWLSSIGRQTDPSIELRSPVPIDLVVEKLRGFISDHRADVLDVTESQVSLQMTTAGGGGRRAADTVFSLSMSIELQEIHTIPEQQRRRGTITETRVTVRITPMRNRDRRHRNWQPSMKQIINSLRSYLMADLVSDDSELNK